MRSPKNQSLWRWICVRILTLAIGSVIAIALCMWLRYIIQNLWIIFHMPQAVRDEFLPLRDHPELNPALFHQIMDQRWGINYSVPSLVPADWIMVGVLVVVIIPFIVVLGLRAARPLSAQFFNLATSARAVSRGEFGIRAALVKNAPAELVRFTDDFNTMTQQLERYERELHASHVAMAHELRSPLTAAIGRVQGMLDGVFQPEAAQLAMVMRQLQLLNRLTDELHLLSLADAGQLTLSKSALSLTEVLRERAAWLKPQAEACGMTITVATNMPCRLMADTFRLGQVFTILMENALRYAAEGGNLSIGVSRYDAGYDITFRDHGPGVLPDFLPSMFERFTRADSSRARDSGGSGLGLSIARAICVAHGGSIMATLPADGGLLITVHLPAH
ncbi:sensor histidine kinase [Acerihabitans sp.]|uniref:sensor histidine kinase n=1 Tax=Acerihabitans sp. TaxID=2811394 RepID=UPI002ED8FB92